jgi:hypothetical protein
MTEEPLSNQAPEPLPLAWIDRIFSKLTARFGRDFLSRWEGIDLAIVKADWSEELAGLQSRVDAIKYAIDHIGGKPPTVFDFKELCSRAPVDGVPRLEAPKADPEGVAKALAKAKDAISKANGYDNLAMLRKLAAEDSVSGTFNGRRVTQAQRETYQQALRMGKWSVTA